MVSTPIAEDKLVLFHPQEYPDLAHKPTNLVSPIRRLPIETLQQIFVHCIPSVPQGTNKSETDTPFPKPNFAQPPLLLMRVCTLWREAAVSTPELWRSIQLCLSSYTHYKAKGEDLRAVLGMWLCNAQAQPLNIALYTPRQFTATAPPGPGSLWDYILPVFISRAHHWSTLIASPAIAKYLLERKVHMPALKTFLSRELVYRRSMDVLRLVPSLLSLSVTTFDDRWLLPQGVAQGLQHLSLLSCDTALGVLTILAYFPRLLSFRLQACWGYEPGIQSVVHQTLEELVVPDVMVLHCVANMLTLPSLRTMIVTGNWDVAHMQAVGSMLCRSSCSLQHLEFSGSKNDNISHLMWHEVEQLFLYSSLIRVFHVNFERLSVISL